MRSTGALCSLSEEGRGNAGPLVTATLPSAVEELLQQREERERG